MGDRTRVRFHSENSQAKDRFFFRSQAADQELGGISRTAFFIAKLLYFLFDLVFIETVGVGQSEVEVQFLADCTILVLQPASGDQIQFFKAGIMEIPNVFVINKCDQTKAVQKDLHALQSSLAFLGPQKTKQEVPLILTSTVNQQGISELGRLILGKKSNFRSSSWKDKEYYYFQKWIRDEFGRQGLRKLHEKGSPRKLIEQCGSFEDAQLHFIKEFQ